MTRDEIDRALAALGWRVIDGPRIVSGGYRACIQRGTRGIAALGHGPLVVLEDLLRSVEHPGRPS